MRTGGLFNYPKQIGVCNPNGVVEESWYYCHRTKIIMKALQKRKTKRSDAKDRHLRKKGGNIPKKVL